MTKKEDLIHQLNTEDNDIKALGIVRKLNRETKNERFLDYWLPKIKQIVDVTVDPKMDKYTMTLSKHGIVDFFPKSNRLLIRKTNTWKNQGLVMLIDELKLRTVSDEKG
jgi:hypothetical protein